MKVSKSKNFTESEYECPHCSKCEMDASFVLMLEKLRVRFREPIILNSAYRCERRNKDVGGVPASAHTKGCAVDIKISGDKAYILMDMALDLEFSGIGVKQHGDYNKRFVHLDNLTGEKRPRIWTYK